MARKSTGNLPAPTGEQYQLVAARLRDSAVDNRIACAAAQAIARELGISPREVGEVADAEGLRISKCQLGCF
ncbi:MAG: hypothetical protein AB1568_12320 [Thermodesulfobacteriota bacterium]